MRASVLGLDYVGLPIAVVLAATGHQASGVEPEAAWREAIAEGRFFAEEALRPLLRGALGNGTLTLDAAPVRGRDLRRRRADAARPRKARCATTFGRRRTR